MIEELKQKMEVFMELKINLFQRQDIHDLDLDIPSEWRESLLNDKYSISDIIHSLWNPISLEATDIIDLLAVRVMDIIIISDFNKELPVQIGYVFKITSKRFQRTYLNAWVAGQPLSKKMDLPTYQENVKPVLPAVYEKFCNIHNGFLLDGNGAIGFLPVERLLVSDKCEKRLLEFCGDGFGNVRCFDLTNEVDSISLDRTVDWDHESLRVSNPMSFWDFAFRFLAANTKSE